MARQGRGRWEVTAVAPRRFRADFGVMDVERVEGEACALVTSTVRYQRVPHLMSYAGIARVFRARWDVVHCWEEPYVRAGAQLAGLAPADAVFVPATFQNITKQYPWPLRAFERRTMTRADGWVAFGETVRSTLVHRQIYQSRPCRTIPPGVDVDRFTPNREAGAQVRQALGWSDTDFVVGYVGRFVVSKGLDVLCAALEQAQMPWRALFVGGGAMESRLRSFEARYSAQVRVITGVPHGDVPRWINAMSVLCAPSQTTAVWREQFGRVLVEAMACGVPVLASASGEMPLVLGDVGIILPESQPAVWGDAITGLAANPDERRDRSARGVLRARAEYSWPAVARRHLEFFEELLEGRTREQV